MVDIILFLIVTDEFSSNHQLSLTILHIQLYYAQYPSLFPFCPVLIHGHLITTQMDIAMIIILVS